MGTRRIGNGVVWRWTNDKRHRLLGPILRHFLRHFTIKNCQKRHDFWAAQRILDFSTFIKKKVVKNKRQKWGSLMAISYKKCHFLRSKYAFFEKKNHRCWCPFLAQKKTLTPSGICFPAFWKNIKPHYDTRYVKLWNRYRKRDFYAIFCCFH